MKNEKLIIIFIVFANLTFGQINGIVADFATKQPIPYVNIWIENSTYGTSSNLKGYFEIKKEQIKLDFIVFSAVGYNREKINAISLTDTFFLKAQISEISEIIISANKKKKEKRIGELKRQFPSNRIGCGKTPYMSARFIPYKKEYEETPFLKSIEFLTHSNIKNAKFSIRFYVADNNNKPKQYLTNKNIIGIAKKGARKTKIDLTLYNIYFPKKGIYVAIEWLIIEENKHIYNYTIKGSSKKYNDGIEYLPSFSAIIIEDKSNVWEYNKGKWEHPFKFNDLYYLLQMEITLTN